MHNHETLLKHKADYERFSREMIKSDFFQDLVRNNKAYRHVMRFAINIGFFSLLIYSIQVAFAYNWLIGTLVFPFYLYFQGLVIAGFMVHSHEFTHHQIKNRRLNDALGIISGIFSWINYYSFQHAHILHHRNIGNIDSPEAGAPISKTGQADIKHTDKSHLLGNKIFSFSILGWFLTSWPLYIYFGDYCSWILPFKQKGHIDRRSLLTFIVFVALNITMLVIAPIGYVILYLIPVLIGGNRILLITSMHHAHEASVFMNKDHHNAYNIIMSNTDRDYGLVINFFMLNNGYHIAHHMNPRIPYYDFKKATDYLRAHIPDHLAYNYFPKSRFYRDFIAGLYEKRLDDNPEFYRLKYISHT